MPPVLFNNWTHPAAASSLTHEAELKKREIQTKLEQLSRRQAARESSTGRLGVGSREQLTNRLRELQRAKAIKAAAAAEHEYAPATHPLSPRGLAPHASPTADAAASLEWSERLRQAKAKYWSNLDQMAPDWKANTQTRRLDQLAKYEKAIDALLVRRQSAAAAYAKERELQRLLTAKQLELHNLAAHEREEVRARQMARGQPAPPSMRAYDAPTSPVRPASAYAPSSHHSRVAAQHFSPAQRSSAGIIAEYEPPQHRFSPHAPSASGYAPGASYRGTSAISALPSDAQLDYESRQSRLAATEREVADLDTWRTELSAEERLRASRREEREAEAARERRLDLDRRRAAEMEHEAQLRATMLHSRGIGAAMVGSYRPDASLAPPVAASNNFRASPPAAASPYGPHSSFPPSSASAYPSSPDAAAPYSSATLTRADPMPPARFDPSPAGSPQPGSFQRDPFTQAAAASPSSYMPYPASSPVRSNPAVPSSSRTPSQRVSFSEPATVPPAHRDQEVAAWAAQKQQEDVALAADRQRADEQRRAEQLFAAQQEREREQQLQRDQEMQRERDYQQQQIQQQAQQQQQQAQQQREQEQREQEERDRQRRFEEEQARQKQQADADAAAAAAKAKFDAEAAAARQTQIDADARAKAAADAAAAESARAAAAAESARVAAAAAAAARPTTPPGASSSDEDPPASRSGFASLFGGLGSSLGFLGKGKKKAPPKARASPTPAAAAATTSTPAAAPAVAPSSSAATTTKKKKSGDDSDDDESSEDDTELRIPAAAPALSSAMLKKKPLAARNTRRPIWQASADDDEDDMGNSVVGGPKAGTLPEDDEFDF